MTFDIPIKRRGRLAINRVTGGRVDDRILALYLSGDLAERLGLGNGAANHLEISLGTSKDHGWLRLAHAREGAEAIIPVHHTPGYQYRLNIRVAYLPDVMVPAAGDSQTLPHKWDGEALLISLQPIQWGFDHG